MLGGPLGSAACPPVGRLSYQQDFGRVRFISLRPFVRALRPVLGTPKTFRLALPHGRPDAHVPVRNSARAAFPRGIRSPPRTRKADAGILLRPQRRRGGRRADRRPAVRGRRGRGHRRDRGLRPHRSGLPQLRRADPAQRQHVRAAGPRLRLPLLRDALVPEPRLRARQRGAAPGARADGGPDRHGGAKGHGGAAAALRRARSPRPGPRRLRRAGRGAAGAGAVPVRAPRRAGRGGERPAHRDQPRRRDAVALPAGRVPPRQPAGAAGRPQSRLSSPAPPRRGCRRTRARGPCR